MTEIVRCAVASGRNLAHLQDKGKAIALDTLNRWKEATVSKRESDGWKLADEKIVWHEHEQSETSSVGMELRFERLNDAD